MRFFRVAVFVVLSLVLVRSVFLSFYMTTDSSLSAALYTKSQVVGTDIPKSLLEFPKHLQTPNSVRAIYVSSWAAGSVNSRNKIIKMIDETELNAVVVDVKDSTGAVSFRIDDPVLQKINPFENRIPDIDSLIEELHKKDIYVIARIAVFEDPHLAKVRPDLAVKRRSTGATWKDRKGLAWSDPGSKEVWDYNIAVAKGAYRIGFDELNFDYIRFPSDGDMADVMYPSLEDKKIDKPETLRRFFHYLNNSLKKTEVPISADLFGMTTTNTDDLNIGQVLENAIPYFDYIDPMVYPSHYPKGFHDYKNPAEVPYELIKFVMGEGVQRILSASSTVSKLRPWLQDFDLGAAYTAPMVRAQIRAVYDVGLNSWLLWNPSSRYTLGALEKN